MRVAAAFRRLIRGYQFARILGWPWLAAVSFGLQNMSLHAEGPDRKCASCRENLLKDRAEPKESERRLL